LKTITNPAHPAPLTPTSASTAAQQFVWSVLPPTLSTRRTTVLSSAPTLTPLSASTAIQQFVWSVLPPTLSTRRTTVLSSAIPLTPPSASTATQQFVWSVLPPTLSTRRTTVLSSAPPFAQHALLALSIAQRRSAAVASTATTLLTKQLRARAGAEMGKWLRVSSSVMTAMRMIKTDAIANVKYKNTFLASIALTRLQSVLSLS
jgi:hypothetical protein